MAPTKVAQFGYRRFDDRGRGSRAAGSSSAPATGWLRGPWAGFTPDLDPSQAEPSAASNCTNLIDREGVLTHMNGWEKVGSATSPLGDAALPSATPEPVIGIVEGRTKATQAVRRYVLTADDGSAGHFFELVSGTWTERALTATHTAIAGASGDASATLVDAAHFAIGDYTIFALGQGNGIIRFPGVGAVNTYEQLVGLGSLTSLTAQSCCSADERMHVFGTTEGGTYYPARWRWSSKGASGAFDPSLTGAGFADLNEFGGQAIAVRPIGFNKMVLYLNNGTLIARRTGITTDPFAKDVTTYGRGLLGTKTVVDLNDGTHFGLFTDGWFRLGANGQWEERGVTDKGYHKWRREFYSNLDWANRSRIVCEYDENDHWVYISWPRAGSAGAGPTDTWIYDVRRDTCWPLTTLGTDTPNCYGKWTEEASAGATWGSMTTTWAGTSGSWGSFESQVGQKRIVHGTGTSTDTGGYVYQHLPSLVTRNGSLPTYNYEFVPFSGERPDRFKSLKGIYVNYTRVTGAGGADPTPISVVATSDSGATFSGEIDHTKGLDRTQQEDFVTGTITAQTHEFAVSGTAPVKIGGVGISVLGSSGEVRKEGAV